MNIAFVVQRYGAEVAGGAEALCRGTARALARAGEHVTVYTTTARDYLSWEPFYPPGTTEDDGVTVRRFAVDPPDPARAADLVRALGLSPGDPAMEGEWCVTQGPVSRDMLAALSDLGDSPARGTVPGLGLSPCGGLLDLSLCHLAARHSACARSGGAGAAGA